MQNTNTRAMIQTGFLTAIVVILSLIATYVPLLGAVGNLLWPVPIIILGIRYGVKWSILATVTAFLVIILFLGPLVAIAEAGTFGVIGILLGMAYRNHWGPGRRILVPSVAFAIAFVLQILFIMYVMHVDLLALFQNAYNDSVVRSVQWYEEMGKSPSEITLLKETMEQQWNLIRMLVPAALVAGGVLVTYVNCLVSATVLRRMGEIITPFPPLHRWQMPRETLYFFIASWVMIYWGTSRSIEWLNIVGANLQVFVIYVLWVQGLAFFAFLCKRHNFSKAMRVVVIVLAVLFPLVQYMFVGAGMMDLAIQYRKKRNFE